MCSLLNSFQKALNKVDGNTRLIEYERLNEYDEYFCTCCKQRFYEDQYNHKQSMCYTCFYKDEEGM